MRLCDRDIEAWLDNGKLAIEPRPPVERINGRPSMCVWVISSAPSAVIPRPLSI